MHVMQYARLQDAMRTSAMLLLVCWSVILSVVRGIDHPQCLVEQPSINRSQVELKVAHFDWLTHNLVTTLAEIICREVLGYTVVRVYPASSQTWGEDITSGLYDLDVEQWHADPLGEQYNDYVVTRATVLDAGSVGYSGRSGLYTFRSMLEKNQLADYYKFYRNSSTASSLGFQTFRDSQLRTFLGESFPACDLDWCGTGDMLGYWAPPACSEAPDDCIEILKATPAMDEGYFEQLVKNHGLHAIFGYYGDALEDHLRSMDAEDVVFYWWEPTLLHAQLDVVRLSFPDHFTGCDNAYVADPTAGTITCDSAEIPLRKVTSRRFRDKAPQGFLALSLLAIDPPDVDGMLLFHDSFANGDHTDANVFATACYFAQQWRHLLPSCLTDPQTVQLRYATKIETFNTDTLSCENVTVLEEVPATTCYESPPALVDRSEHEITIPRRRWLSHNLVSMVAEIILREYLGYSVVSVNHVNYEDGMSTIADLALGLLDVEIENWEGWLAAQYYESGQLHFAGPLGYDGREGLYVIDDAMRRNDMADYFKFYKNATEATQLGFMPHSESPLYQFLPDDTPQPCINGSGLSEWCGTGDLQGYWPTPACAQNPGRCVEVAMEYPGWGYGIPEQASKNSGLELVFAYYGPVLWQAVPHIHSVPGRFVPFFAWEPDGPLLRYQAHRISFPDVRIGCLDGNPLTPAGDVLCDIPATRMEKVINSKVASLAEARFALESMHIGLDEINAMIARHVAGGGQLQTASEVACEFVRSHKALMQTWAPDCMVRPPPPEDIRINDTVFSQREGRCAPISCEPSKILTYSSAFTAFGCEECREGEIPDATQRSCRFCEPGEQPDQAGVGCTACFPGTSAPARSGECIACAPGRYSKDDGKSACDECPLGSYTSLTGTTACSACSAGSYADELGSTACKECVPGFYKENSTAPHQCFPCEQGRFTSAHAATGCETCSFGTTEVLGALGVDYCTCPSSTFLFRAADGEPQCLACNSYMEPCQGGEHLAQQRAGYHISADGAIVHRCASKDACPAGPLGTCSVGSTGPGCAQCEVGKYVWNGDRCARCGATDSVYALIAPVLLACVLWTIYHYGNEPTSRKLSSTSEFIILAGLTANIFFYLSSFEGFDVAWEQPVDGVLELFSSISTELTGFHLSCSTRSTNVMNYILSSVIPALIIIIFILLALFRIASARKLFNTLASGTYALYLLLLIHALKPFRYIVHPYGGKSMLGLPDVFEGSAEHTSLVISGICVIIFYCAPFAALCVLATVHVSRSRTTAQRRWWLTTFRFLFYKFRPEVFYWGVYILGRNAFFALAPSVAPEIPKIGVFILTFVTSGSMAHTALANPWRYYWMTIVDVTILAYILLVLNLAAGWAREKESADSYLASGLVSIGGLACACAGYIVLRLLVTRMCADGATLEKLLAESTREDAHYMRQESAFFQDPLVEVSDAFEVLSLEQTGTLGLQTSEGSLAWQLSVIQKEQTTMLAIVGIAQSMRDPDYHLQHFYEDCMHAFPELQLYNQDVMRGKSANAAFGEMQAPSSAVGGHTLAEEQQRTMGAFFTLYCLCRLDMNGKEVMSFGVDEERPHVVKGIPTGMKQDELKAVPWGKMTPSERRANFYWNFDWQLMETLLLEAGILLRIGEKGLAVDDRPEGRLVAMLSLTAYHDIMKDQTLCPCVERSDYEGHKVGERILDHDLALAYLLDRHPDVLPSFRILTIEQQRLVRFTQADMGFNAGWLVQAEGPPSAVLRKLKSTISQGGVHDKDVAFYFVHWVTDLAGAEPTPFTGSEKLAAKFPPVVLQGLLGCFSIVRMLADHTETEVYEAYLRQRWQSSQTKEITEQNLPEGRDGIARMRLLCMAQAGANAVLNEFDRLSDFDRDTLVQELSETGMPGQQYSGCSEVNGEGAGTPFLLYYGPAWCQRVGQQQPALALKILAEVFRLSREAFPESRDRHRDEKEGILSRTIEVGLLKSANTEVWNQHYVINDNSTENDVAVTTFTMFVVERTSHLEGTLREALDEYEV